MATRTPPPSPQELWRSQKEEETKMSVEEIRLRAQAFQKKIRRRNQREYVGIVVGTVVYVAFMWFLPGALIKFGAALTLAAMYWSVYQLHRDGAAREVPDDSSAGDCLAFHRSELIRQRDMLRRVGPRHVAPMTAGLAVFFAGAWTTKVQDRESALTMAACGLFAAALMVLVWRLNVRAAKKLEREIETIEY